jgi:glycosyltransferase involved in cell wall biosynthesis
LGALFAQFRQFGLESFELGRLHLAAVEQRSWASYLGSIPAEMMANAMRKADVILNNSQTEGLANALLEATSLAVPILARNIPGNAAIVEHGSNGLLYSTREEFCQQALRLLDRQNRKRLSCSLKNRYDPGNETKELIAMLQKTMLLRCCGDQG